MNKNQTLLLDSSKRVKFIPGQVGWHRDISFPYAFRNLQISALKAIPHCAEFWLAFCSAVNFIHCELYVRGL